MPTFIRILFIVPLLVFAIIGIVLLLILCDIKRHPLSVFHWINVLRQLPG